MTLFFFCYHYGNSFSYFFLFCLLPSPRFFPLSKVQLYALDKQDENSSFQTNKKRPENAPIIIINRPRLHSHKSSVYIYQMKKKEWLLFTYSFLLLSLPFLLKTTYFTFPLIPSLQPSPSPTPSSFGHFKPL